MNASHLIESDTRAHTVDGYTAWHMVAEAHQKTIRRLVDELNVLNGLGQRPQAGCAFTTKYLGDAEVKVEYEFSPGDPGRYSGPPENCYPAEPAEVTVLQVFINGTWADPSDFVADAVLERWAEEIEGECTTAADEDRSDYDDSADDYLADMAADRYQRDIDARHA